MLTCQPLTKTLYMHYFINHPPLPKLPCEVGNYYPISLKKWNTSLNNVPLPKVARTTPFILFCFSVEGNFSFSHSCYLNSTAINSFTQMSLPMWSSSRICPGVKLLVTHTTLQGFASCLVQELLQFPLPPQSGPAVPHTCPCKGLQKPVILRRVRWYILTDTSCAFFSVHASVWADGQWGWD